MRGIQRRGFRRATGTGPNDAATGYNFFPKIAPSNESTWGHSRIVGSVHLQFASSSGNSNSGKLIRSTDGVTFDVVDFPDPGPTAKAISWLVSDSVVVGGIIYAIGYSTTTDLSYIWTSDDLGLTWTVRDIGLPATSRANAIAYGAGVFVVVNANTLGISEKLFWSSDLLTWTPSTLPEISNLRDVTFGGPTGGECFILLASSGTNRIQRSTDGKTFVGVNTDATFHYRVEWGGPAPGYFVAWSASPGPLRTSPDGITWTRPTVTGAPTSYSNGAWNEAGQFWTASNGTAIYTSPNVINWSTLVNRQPASGLIVCNQVYSAVTECNYQGVYFSLGNGISQVDKNLVYSALATPVLPGPPNQAAVSAVFDVAYLPTAKLYGTGYGLNQPANVAVGTSSDGATWNQTAYFADSNQRTGLVVGYPGGVERMVSVGSSGGGVGALTCGYSDDGVTWTGAAGVGTGAYADVAWGNGVFVAVASTGSTRAMSSPDGVTWTGRTINTGVSYRSVTFISQLGIFVACGQGGTAANRIATSTDGVTWTYPSPNTEGFHPNSVAFDGTKFVFSNSVQTAGGSDSRSFFSSYDLINFFDVVSLPNGNFYLNGWITYGGPSWDRRWVLMSSVWSGIPSSATLRRVWNSKDGVIWRPSRSSSGAPMHLRWIEQTNQWISANSSVAFSLQPWRRYQ